MSGHRIGREMPPNFHQPLIPRPALEEEKNIL